MAVSRHGYIKLHRTMLDEPVFQSPGLFHVYSYCLLRAQYKDGYDMIGTQKVNLLPSEFVSRRTLDALALGIPEVTYYRRLQKLEELGYISLVSTSKFTVVTVEKWAFHQGDEPPILWDGRWTEAEKDKKREGATFPDSGITFDKKAIDRMVESLGEEQASQIANFLVKLREDFSSL